MGCVPTSQSRPLLPHSPSQKSWPINLVPLPRPPCVSALESALSSIEVDQELRWFVSVSFLFSHRFPIPQHYTTTAHANGDAWCMKGLSAQTLEINFAWEKLIISLWHTTAPIIEGML